MVGVVLWVDSSILESGQMGEAFGVLCLGSCAQRKFGLLGSCLVIGMQLLNAVNSYSFTTRSKW